MVSGIKIRLLRALDDQTKEPLLKGAMKLNFPAKIKRWKKGRQTGKYQTVQTSGPVNKSRYSLSRIAEVY